MFQPVGDSTPSGAPGYRGTPGAGPGTSTGVEVNWPTIFAGLPPPACPRRPADTGLPTLAYRHWPTDTGLDRLGQVSSAQPEWGRQSRAEPDRPANGQVRLRLYLQIALAPRALDEAARTWSSDGFGGVYNSDVARKRRLPAPSRQRRKRCGSKT